MYVDDILAGALDLDTALIALDQITSALASAKFELSKWASNDRPILDVFSCSPLVDAQVLYFV